MNALTATATTRPVAPSATAGGPDQEFSFSHADFERVRALIYQRAGISLHAGKQAMVYRTPWSSTPPLPSWWNRS